MSSRRAGRRSDGAAVSFHRHSGNYCSVASSVIFVFRSFDTGQPALALPASSSNVALSAPGIFAFSVRCTDVTTRHGSRVRRSSGCWTSTSDAPADPGEASRSGQLRPTAPHGATRGALRQVAWSGFGGGSGADWCNRLTARRRGSRGGGRVSQRRLPARRLGRPASALRRLRASTCPDPGRGKSTGPFRRGASASMRPDATAARGLPGGACRSTNPHVSS